MRTLLVLLISSVALAGYPPREKRAALHLNMEDTEVKALLGEPDAIDGGFCPDPLSKAKRECQTWHYRSDGHELSLELQYNSGSYLLAGWKDK